VAPSSSDQLTNARCVRLAFAGARRNPESQRPLGNTQMLGKQQLAASVFGRLLKITPSDKTCIGFERMSWRLWNTELLQITLYQLWHVATARMIQVIRNLEELAATYTRDGFVRVPGFFGPELLREVRDQLERYERDIAPRLPEGDRVIESDGRSIRNLWRLEQHDPYFKQLAEGSEICSLISALVGGTPVLMAVETFNKPPKVGSGVPPHQDNAYFCQSPPDALTVWIALDAATSENGPIYY
jgi:hypothetical protein